jgi:hypothetical protein
VLFFCTARMRLDGWLRSAGHRAGLSVFTSTHPVDVEVVFAWMQGPPAGSRPAGLERGDPGRSGHDQLHIAVQRRAAPSVDDTGRRWSLPVVDT